jgi:hypothetical protein
MISSPFVCTDRLEGDQRCFYFHVCLFFPGAETEVVLQIPSVEILLILPAGGGSKFLWTHNHQIMKPDQSLIALT